jgi:hypothetical protein
MKYNMGRKIRLDTWSHSCAEKEKLTMDSNTRKVKRLI